MTPNPGHTDESPSDDASDGSLSTEYAGPTPRVAVVVPCFNDGRFVGDAIASVQEQEPVELVVVDDGSTDPGTIEVLRRAAEDGVRVKHQVNGGLSAARMAGVSETSARYVFPLDADDQLEPGALAKLADVLDADDSIAFVYGHLRFTGVRVGGRRAQPWNPFTLLYANRWGPMCMYRREALVSVGGWSFPDIYEDWDLLLALAEHGHRGAPVDHLVVHYRRHEVPRMNVRGYERYASLYRQLRERHRPLFESRARLARENRVPLWRQAAYPLVLGARPLYPFFVYSVVDSIRDRYARWLARRQLGLSSGEREARG